jgi:hypothetical protein
VTGAGFPLQDYLNPRVSTISLPRPGSATGRTGHRLAVCFLAAGAEALRNLLRQPTLPFDEPAIPAQELDDEDLAMLRDPTTMAHIRVVAGAHDRAKRGEVVDWSSVTANHILG